MLKHAGSVFVDTNLLLYSVDRRDHRRSGEGRPSWQVLLASAERLGCAILLTADFQTGRQYGSVQVIDPFGTEPPSGIQPS